MPVSSPFKLSFPYAELTVVRATISEGPSPTRRYDCMNKSISTDACCSQQFNTANSATAVYSDIQRFCTDPNGNQFQ
ncbi:hypothetical protein MJO29_001426 [Puccinia striiformis f. sp. tritici]|nr:hypothetical protein MJO29_001426 [Puccinia striiformis f. sp. tritici]